MSDYAVKFKGVIVPGVYQFDVLFVEGATASEVGSVVISTQNCVSNIPSFMNSFKDLIVRECRVTAGELHEMIVAEAKITG